MTDNSDYGFGLTTDLEPAEAEERLRAALAEQGFGILTEIDVAETLASKLGVERPSYRILGACNPELANQALEIEEDIGLLLPCNIIVYRQDDATAVRALEPRLMASVTGNRELGPIAEEARERLERALATIPRRT